MRKLGVSIYPGSSTLEDNISYLTKAANYGFSRVFTCLISMEGDKNKALEEFRRLNQHARDLSMAVFADVSPAVFEGFHVSHQDLSFFADLKLAGIRLDLGFSGMEESFMTYNPHGLKIEINMSNGTRYLDNILSYQPNLENLVGCHNFYPHRYTGLSRGHFMITSRDFKEKGIRTAAFVSSNSGSIGPWRVNEGLCTLEEHRGQPIAVQAKDIFNTQLIDDVIIANAFASDAELKALGEMDKNILELRVELIDALPQLERRLVFEEHHFNRGDVSDYMIRSTQGRIKYRDVRFELINPAPIKRGDILIESSLYDRYAGELQIALKDMENSGRTSVVGRVKEEELFLIDDIKPWQSFKFK